MGERINANRQFVHLSKCISVGCNGLRSNPFNSGFFSNCLSFCILGFKLSLSFVISSSNFFWSSSRIGTTSVVGSCKKMSPRQTKLFDFCCLLGVFLFCSLIKCLIASLFLFLL